MISSEDGVNTIHAIRALEQYRLALLSQIQEKLKEMRKPVLPDADIQLLDRHQREEYNEQVVGYNTALTDVSNYLKELE